MADVSGSWEVRSLFAIIRRLLFGRPLPTSRQRHERLDKLLALPVFASDALSSVAYATEEILKVLLVVGAAMWSYSLPIAGAILALLVIVVTSYRLTIMSYPQGGGSYIVAKENLGASYGLAAAAALLTGYVVTVAVSIAAGVSAIISLYPGLEVYRVELGIVFVALVALANLRGVRESGVLFAVPTYMFVLSMLTMIVAGLIKWAIGDVDYVVQPAQPVPSQGTVTLLLVLTAFSRGCSAMTGTEAIADGVPAFKPPEARNAAATLVMMAVILGTLFTGITILASVYRVLPGTGAHGGGETVVSQIARNIFQGNLAWFYPVIQFVTTAILILAANTAYQDFPRLSSILARDRFAPRQFANIGDRLVFTNGILALSALAVFLIVYFGGDVSRMIPLYAVGVFMSFTLSQAGMSRRLSRLKPPGWQYLSKVSAFGALVTFMVTVISATVNFLDGAWIVLLIIPILVFIYFKINQHYMELGDQLRLTEEEFKEPKPVKSTAIVLTAGIHKGILPALEYARSLSHDYRALYIEIDPADTVLIRDRWEKFGLGVPLVILESPYRSVVGPVLDYLEEAKKERPDHIITVILPEFVPVKWWHKILHNQSGLFLKIALLFRRDIVVTNVRYYLEK